MKYILFIISCHLLLTTVVRAQDDLLNDLETAFEQPTFIYPAFKANKIANLESTKVAEKGDLYMYVSHRFGTIKDGISTFFGLDNANTKIQFIHGVSKNIQVGISRESFRKTYGGSIKASIMRQKKGLPVNISLYGTMNINTQIKEAQFPSLVFADRLSYASQILVSRRFSNRLSLLLAPTYVRQNLVWEQKQAHDQFALGIGGRYKLTKRISLNGEYVAHLNRAGDSNFHDLLSLGVDIETGGHVFQLLFSNSPSTNEPSFITNATGDWTETDIFFGFNIVRVF